MSTIGRSVSSGSAAIACAVHDERLRERPGSKAYEGKSVVVGIRPEDMEDASWSPMPRGTAGSAPPWTSASRLGQRCMVHFTIDAPVVLTEDTKELADDVGAEALGLACTSARRRRPRRSSRSSIRGRDVRESEQVELVVDTGRLHFFDPETGLGIYGEGES